MINTEIWVILCEDGRSGHEPGKTDGCYILKMARNRNPPSGPPEGANPSDTLTLAQIIHFGFLTSQTSKQ